MKQKTFILTVVFLACMAVLAGLAVLTLAAIALMPSSKASRLDMSLVGARIGVVDIEGMIWNAKPWVDQINEFAENPRVKAIVLNVNSPGGGVAASQELYEAVRKVRTEHKKHVVAYFGSVAASGGYYAACGAKEIFASPGCITGSIGVYMQFGNWEGLYDKLGIAFKTIQRGKYKTAGASDRDMTPEEEAMLQAMVDDIYEQFIEAVVEGRYDAVRRRHNDLHELQDSQANNPQASRLAVAGDSSVAADVASAATSDKDDKSLLAVAATSFDVEARIRELAEGRIYTGKQAQELGLVDELGFLDDAIQRAAELAQISGKPVTLRRDRRKDRGFDFLSRINEEVQAHTEGTRPFVAYLMPFAGIK